jgi:hypothetical protein
MNVNSTRGMIIYAAELCFIMMIERHIFLFLKLQVEIPFRIMMYISVVLQNLQSDFVSESHNQILFFVDIINYIEK